MVGQQPDGVQSQVGEDLGADAVLVLELPLAGFALVVHEFAAVGYQPRLAAGIALDAETGTALMQVNQHAGLAVEALGLVFVVRSHVVRRGQRG